MTQGPQSDINILGKMEVSDRQLTAFLGGRARSVLGISPVQACLLAHLADSGGNHFDRGYLHPEVSVTLSRPEGTHNSRDFIKADLGGKYGIDQGTFYVNTRSGEFVFKGTKHGSDFTTATDALFSQRKQAFLFNNTSCSYLEDETLEHVQHIINFLQKFPDQQFNWGDQSLRLFAESTGTDSLPCFHAVLFHRDGRSSVTHINPTNGDYLHMGTLPPEELTTGLAFMMELYQVKIFEQEGRVMVKDIAELSSNDAKAGDRLERLRPELVSELHTLMTDGSASRFGKGLGDLKHHLMMCMVAPKGFPALMRYLKDLDKVATIDDTAELVERLMTEGLSTFSQEDLLNLLSKPDEIVARVSPVDLRLWGMSDPHNPWSPFVDLREE